MISIFDFDGVIVESTRMKHELFLQLAVSHGFPMVEALDHALKTILVGAERTCVAEWIVSQKREFPVALFLASFADQVRANDDTLTLTVGFREFLEQLNRQDKKSYIVSSAPKADILRILGKFEVNTNQFSGIFGGENKQDILSSLLKTNSTPPGNCIFFGDMPSDFIAAINCRIPFCRVESFMGGFCSWPDSLMHSISNFSWSVKLQKLCTDHIGMTLSKN